MESFAAVSFPRWNFFYRFSAPKQEQVPTGKYGVHVRMLHKNSPGLAEFILETSYPSRRIIRQTDNSSKYKSEDEFCSIMCLDILSGKRPREKGNIAKI